MIVIVFCLASVDIVIVALSYINSVILIIIDVVIFGSTGSFVLTCAVIF